VTSSAAAQVTFFSYHAPHPDDLLSLIGITRQWSRPASADFYAPPASESGTTGGRPAHEALAGGELAGPSAAPQPYLEQSPTCGRSSSLRTHGLIHDCPKLVQLRTFPRLRLAATRRGGRVADRDHLPPGRVPSAGPTGDPSPHRNPRSSRLVLAEMATARSASDDTDAAGPVRMISAHPESLSDLAARVRTHPIRPGRTLRRGSRPDQREGGVPPDGRAGVTVITLGNHRGSNYRIRVAEDGTADDRLPGQSFRQVTARTDHMSAQQATRVARKLAGWSITGTIIDKRAQALRRKWRPNGTSWSAPRVSKR